MPLLFTCGNSLHLEHSLLNSTPLTSGKYRLGRFADGEVSFFLDQPVKGRVCVVLGSTGSPADNLLELITIINTLKINRAKKIITVIPYLGYSRSDRQKPLQPINARLFLKFLAEAGTDRFLTLSLHSSLVEKYFIRKNLHLSTAPIFAEQITKLKLKNLAIATPDLGGRQRALDVARVLDLKDIIVFEKHRPSVDTTEVSNISGPDPSGKDIVFIDDMIQTGHTLLNAARSAKAHGARTIIAFSTHCVYHAKGIKLLSSSTLFSKIFITNSLSKEYNLSSKVSILDISPLLSASLSSLL